MNRPRSVKLYLVAGFLLANAWSSAALAQVLEEIVVTAQRRAEDIQDVPLSVTALEGQRLDALFEAGEDIRALATRLPSLYAESSNGRLAPRFYIRGLGNSDFDLAASQPVSIIVDEVVQENVILKSFPLFDIERVELLRGPQGTLFGRNTPAGIVKFDTRKPTRELDGYATLSYAQPDTLVAQGAIGGPLGDKLSGRLSILYQDRSDWIDNVVPAGSDFNQQAGSNAMGGFEEAAYRAQLLFEPTEDFSALLNLHGRKLDNGTASIFRANVLGIGTNGFNSNFDRDAVTFDEGANNPQEADAFGGSLRLEIDITGGTTLTSITAFEEVDNMSRGDIDGGFGADFLPTVGPCPPGTTPGVDTCIPFPSHTADGLVGLEQITQEFRLASSVSDALYWQAGVYYFNSDFEVFTDPFFIDPTNVTHKNEAWALFGHLSVDVSDTVNLTGGVRYTDDSKDFDATGEPVPVMPVSVSGDEVSWDLAGRWSLSEETKLYGRVARGFRAPTIQGRDVAFFGQPSIADSETITSFELGLKSTFADGRVRVNGAVFTYEIEDQQLSAIGGGGNFVQLVNADKGTGTGIDLDTEFLLGENLLVTAGLSLVDTELKDNTLVIPPCGNLPDVAGSQANCTVLDATDANGNAIVNGNSFVQAPEYIFTLTADYSTPIGTDGELFFFTDWAFQGETQFFLYESAEFFSDDTYEGGVRFGYRHVGQGLEVAVFGRNVTDEENVKGAIDFNNLTGFDNERRFWGLSVTKNW